VFRRASIGDRSAVHDDESEEANMSISKAHATWDGTLKEGKGVMKPANGAESPFSMGTRFEGKPGTNPEEMIGAALAGCFSMALSLGLQTAGATPRKIKTTSDVKLEKVGDGFSITKIELSTEVEATGIDEAKFQQVAEQTKKGCPVGKALSAVEIGLRAKLVAG
jgi:lipoyl-dependent peroxiredoxin